MRQVRLALSLACLVGLATAQFADPIISINGGLEFRLPDGGYRGVMIQYNVNKPLSGVAAGEHVAEIKGKTGNEWVYTDSSVQLNPGDTINYWVVVFKTNGEGVQITDRSWTYVATTTTTRRTSTPPTPPRVQTVTKLHTPPPSTSISSNTATNSASQTGSHVIPADTVSGGSGFNAGVPTGSNNGGSSGGSGGGSGSGTFTSGSCNCDYGPGRGDGFVDDRTCKTFPCLIFEDNFDFIDHRVWEHEITAGGGGNWEFQYYTNNRSNSYTRDGILYIKPTLTSDHYGTEYLMHGVLDLWGSSAGDACTSNMDWGCKREGRPDQILNPIQSARLRSSRGFNFRYGKVEVDAKLPKGDWLWPAIWMLPKLNVYGKWPASGEIDIMESRGNLDYHDPQGTSLGADSVGSTLHFGADFFTNQWSKAHKEIQLSGGTYADDFHKYGVEWDNTSITFTLDGQETLRVAPGNGGFWELGGLNHMQGHENPWRGASRMAPFDQEFYLLMNVAVGGTGFFQDENRNSPYPKPWADGAGHESDRFWAARNQWYPTWHPEQNNGESAAMKVNYVKVWKTKPDP